MFNSFHMNPWFHLLTIPISAIIIFNPIAYHFSSNLLIYYLINLLIVLIILFILYLTNKIGLYDLFIFLAIISILSSPPLLLYKL